MLIFIETYGCAFNRADSNSLSHAIMQAGHAIAENEEDADIIVINSCSVKDATEQRILCRLNRLKKRGKKVLVTGCLAQADPQKILRINSSAAVLGTFSQKSVAQALKAVAEGKQFIEIGKKGFVAPQVTVEGIVAKVQIARGCQGSCSFCQTKLARGALESIPTKDIVRLCEEAVEQGAKELQLTAQDTGCYGFDQHNGIKLPELLQAICKIEGDFRVRVGMMSPEHGLKMLPELRKAFENKKVYKFFHIPLQSGSNSVLKQMRRKYCAEDFEALVKAIRLYFTEAMLETDVIVGFPTESAEDFAETLELLKKIKPDLTNVSRYSARPKTTAAQLKQLPAKIINARAGESWRLCRKIAGGQLQRRMKNKNACKVLVVEKQKNAWLSRDENYAPILLKRGKLGEFATVQIVGSTGSVLWGERVG